MRREPAPDPGLSSEATKLAPRRGATRSTPEYTAVETELDGFRILRNDRAVADAAMSAVGELAERSDECHRVPLTDALIAAAAAEHGAIALPHRDTHFDKLAEALTFENVQLPGS